MRRERREVMGRGRIQLILLYAQEFVTPRSTHVGVPSHAVLGMENPVQDTLDRSARGEEHIVSNFDPVDAV